MSTEKIQGCELCRGTARMYCESDEARLCFDCDAKVHSANFLVARHRRTLLCRSCQGPTPWKAEGARLGPTMSVCQRCFDSKSMNANDDRSNLKVDGEEEDDYDDDDESEDDEGEEQVVPGVEEGESLDAISSSCCSSNGDGVEEEEEEEEEEDDDDDDDDDEGDEEESGRYYVKPKRTTQNVLLDLLSSAQDQQGNSPLLNRTATMKMIRTDDDDKDTSKLLRPSKLQKKLSAPFPRSRQLAINCPPI